MKVLFCHLVARIETAAFKLKKSPLHNRRPETRGNWKTGTRRRARCLLRKSAEPSPARHLTGIHVCDNVAIEPRKAVTGKWMISTSHTQWPWITYGILCFPREAHPQSTAGRLLCFVFISFTFTRAASAVKVLLLDFLKVFWIVSRQPTRTHPPPRPAIPLSRGGARRNSRWEEGPKKQENAPGRYVTIVTQST